MTEKPTHSDGDTHQEDQEADESTDSSAEQAKTRELEMEKSGEENAS